MNASPFFDWLARTSWQASVLVLLVLAVQRVFRGRLNSRWQYALWLLIVARLAMPALPASPWSVFNALHYASAAKEVDPEKVELTNPEAANLVNNPTPNSGIVPENTTDGHSEAPRKIVARVRVPIFDSQKIMFDAEIVWLVGVLLLGGRGVGQSIVFVRRLRGAKAVSDPEMLALFAECKEMMGVSAPLRLAETDQVSSPALHGFFRPSLLLPRAIIGQFTPDEQRHIFLHELAHVKRWDMAVHWVAAVFRLLHWFNPVLWFGFQRMAADRELACDELALGRAGEDQARPYGETVLKLLELCATPAVLPGLMGILEEKSQMTRRILMIARYRQQAGWPIVAMLLLAGLGLVTLTDAEINKAKSEPASALKASKPDLIGHVHLTNGEPLVASVFIETAGPKVGTSTYCPSCYADCVKHTKSDDQGRFKIESLDPTLIFRILVVAKNYAPKYVTKVDPAKGPIDVMLEPRDNSKSPPENTMRGRVVDANGKPVVGAAVETGGVHYKDGGGQWGGLKDIDPLAVTDEKGEFLIASLKPFASLDVNVEARGFAHKTFTELRSGSKQHDLTVTEGAVVTGRVILNAKPLPNVLVGIVSTDRGVGNSTVNFEIGTGPDGRFVFLNLPPSVQYNLHGIMESVQKYGAVTPMHISTGGDGSSVDAGDLIVGPAHRISGRVILDDGKPIPAKTRLMIDREDAWDSLHLELDKNGGFDTGGIATGVADLSVRVPGYGLSKKNGSLDRLNPFRLVGQVNQDISGLTILLEKGKDLEADYSNQPVDDGPETRPLRGIENPPSLEDVRSLNWSISGRVTDAKTGQPLKTFLITPGNKRFREISFDKDRKAQGTNAAYSVDVNKRFAEPWLKVEADGYIPIAVRPPLADANHFDIKLEPGSGPSGIVLRPDGKPARNVTVGLICAGQHGMVIQHDATLQSWQRGYLVKTTDQDGRFSFAPELEMTTIAASSAEGFKLVSVAELAWNPKMMLEPWGRVTGTLRRPSGPGTNEDLDLGFAPETLSEPFTLQTGAHAATDDAGRFEFDRVPPGKLDLTYRVKISENAWHQEPLQTVTVSPGQTLKLKIDASERQTSGVHGFYSKPQEARRTGTDIKGTVFMPNGAPAHFIQVALLVSNQVVRLGKGSINTSFKAGVDNSLVTTTDIAGRFNLPGMEGAMGIIAVHEAGYAKIDMPTSGSAVLKLEPWGEIHGTLRIGRRLGVNQKVTMRDFPFDGLEFDPEDFRAQTDDKGHFVMTYVPPGERGLARNIPRGAGSFSSGTPVSVLVKAGGITEVTIGGNGREVTGTVVCPVPPAGFDWNNASFSLHTVRPPGDGKNNANWKIRSFSPEATTNGSFVFEDVPPGAYELSVNVAPPLRQFYQPFDYAANLQSYAIKEVVVPDVENGKSDEPYNLGTIELHTVHPLKIGDTPPLVEGQNAEGQKVNTTDFLGKYFLLHVVMNDSSPDAVQQLRTTFEAFGNDDRFAMLSFFGWQSAPGLKEFARTNNILWNVATLVSPRPELADYFKSVTNYATGQTVLVGPDGKIIAKDLQGDAIKEAVANALAHK